MLPKLMPTTNHHTSFPNYLSPTPALKKRKSPRTSYASYRTPTPISQKRKGAHTTIRSISKRARVSSDPEDSAAEIGYLRSVSAFGDDEDNGENADGDFETDQDAVRAFEDIDAPSTPHQDMVGYAMPPGSTRRMQDSYIGDEESVASESLTAPKDAMDTMAMVEALLGEANSSANFEALRTFLSTLGNTTNRATKTPVWDTMHVENLLKLCDIVLPPHYDIVDRAAGTSLTPTPKPTPTPAPALPTSPDKAKKKKPSTTIQWWSRFTRIRSLADMSLSPYTRKLISDYQSNPASLPSLLSLPALELPTNSCTGTLGAEAYAKHYAYMLVLETACTKTPILSIAMHIFFYLASCTSPNHANLQALSPSSTHTRTTKLFDSDMHRLFNEWKTFLPPDLPFKEFKAKIKEWKRIGSCYMFIAQHLGLGSLLYLHQLLDPTKMWGAWTGGREDCAKKAMECLEGLGMREVGEREGAGVFMREVLSHVWRRAGANEVSLEKI